MKSTGNNVIDPSRNNRKTRWMLGLGVGLVAGVLGIWQLQVCGQSAAGDAAVPQASGEKVVDADSVVGIPVHFTLTKPSYVTLAIENAQGKRVRNLIAETQFPAGDNMIIWDGYDDRGNRVDPGDYKLRGLTHDGIRVYYEFSFNTAGNPPWFTAEHTGGWMSDHVLPNTAVFLPKGSSPYAKGESQVFLASILAEDGDPMIFADLTGQKVYGNHFFGWDGAAAGARDVGPAPRQDYFVYMVMGWEGKRLTIRALAPDGSAKDKIVEIATQRDYPREPAAVGISLAVYNSIAAISLPLDNTIQFYDLTNAKLVGSIRVNSPKGLAYDKDGVLYALAGNQIHRYELNPAGAKTTVANDKVLVSKGIVAGYGLALDDNGLIYITDQGRSHQVKVFTANGAPLRTIGKAGGLQLGLYDEERMQNPEGLAVDDKGQIWVCEYDAWPKRVSLWEASTGKFIKGLYGPPMYGGGGELDSQDPTRIFYSQYGGLTQWKVDWEKGKADLYAINVRRSMQGTAADIARWSQSVPDHPMTIKGRTYLVPGYNGGLRYMDNAPVFLLDDRTHVAWPVAFVGTMRRWVMDNPGEKHPMQDVIDSYPPKEGEDWLRNYNDTLLAWSDTNNNHKFDLNEWKHRRFPQYSTIENGKTVPLNRKEVVQTVDGMAVNTEWMFHLDPPSINDKTGVPTYDLGSARALIPITPDMGGNEEGMAGFTTPSGKILKGLFKEVDTQGKTIWEYPDLPAPAVPNKPGDVTEPTRLLGEIVKAKVGEAGEWYAVNGERGSMYLMTSDGLFIQTIGGHMSRNPLIRFPQATRGMLIDSPENHISWEDEHFHPSITQVAKDGKIYLSAGKEFSAIFRVDGFETIKRLGDTTLSVTGEQLARIPAHRPAPTKSEYADKLPAVISSSPIVVDGKLNDWSSQTAWAPLDAAVSVAVSYQGDDLYLAYKTGDPKAIDNDGANYQFMFKTGGGFDLQWRPDPGEAGNRRLLGMDRRLLISKRKGKISAAMFFPVADESNAPADSVLYESPIGKVHFAKVEDVSSMIKVAGDGTGNFEIAIPGSILEVKPRPRMELLADVGMIRGNGTQNLQRLYWHNRDTALVSDIPSEARLQPANWGRIQFVADANSHDGSIVFSPQKAKLNGGGFFQVKKMAGDEYSVGFWTAVGNTLEWADQPITPGKYSVELTYGCGNNVANPFVVDVGGQQVDAKTENTGSWDTYRTVTLGQVEVKASTVTITMKPKAIEGAGLMDFKELRLIPATAGK